MVAVLCREEPMLRIAKVIDSGAVLFTSPLAMFEATLAIVHRKDCPPQKSALDVSALVSQANMAIVDIEPDMFEIAVSAFERFGKGHHKAKLNLGDCFAYAVAKSRNASILFVGDDFTHTDLPDALAAI